MTSLTRRNLLRLTAATALLARYSNEIHATERHISMKALNSIRAIDYTVIFARDMKPMIGFYKEVMGFPLRRELGPQWVEFTVGSQIMALTERGMMWNDTPTPAGQLSVQLAFRVAPDDVALCEAELREKGIEITLPTTDQPWGHRTLFFRDPDGNILEIYADI